jgi:hypothetical protein
MRSIALALLVLATPLAADAQDAVPSSQLVLSAHAAPAPATVLSATEQEQFLLTAKLGRVSGAKKGITGTHRATLSDGGRAHDVSIQSIDETKSRFESASRVELNFRDYWGYNVAAYRLGLMLDLDLIPPSVPRKFRGEDAAFTWWVDDVMMDEQERSKTRHAPPDASYWSEQIHILRVFDELIANTDRNQGNMLIDRQWKLWLIDHTRGFRITKSLRTPQIIRRCERHLLERMKALTFEDLKAQLGKYLTDTEMKALLERRDRLVAHVEALGPTALYDLKRPS